MAGEWQLLVFVEAIELRIKRRINGTESKIGERG